MAGRVRVLSERFMVPGKETAVKKLMLEVEQNVRKQAGFVRGEVLRDTSDPSLYIILTEWDSMKHLKKWFATDFYKKQSEKLNETLQTPSSYRILKKQKDDIFLL
mmetsp:Transcript_8822/g.11120  ORF Transcript_8822/g.11120 Transcript_8822/m.11120 type:complete len:105 (-) Transcript_8822:788-1102(-)